MHYLRSRISSETVTAQPFPARLEAIGFTAWDVENYVHLSPFYWFMRLLLLCNKVGATRAYGLLSQQCGLVAYTRMAFSQLGYQDSLAISKPARGTTTGPLPFGLF